MRAKIWGCRGSLAAAGPETVRYGGNTSCVEVRLDDGTLIVLDAGTGVRKLGLELTREPVPQVHLLLTHLHIDHLEGIGFFSPIWDADVDLHIWGPPSTTRPLVERIATLMSPPLFPVHVGDVPSEPTFHDTHDGEIRIGEARILAQTVAHRGPTVGYRIEADGSTFVYIPDHEPGRGIDLTKARPDWISGFALADGADVLLHDAQYSEEEYPRYAGWGHSSIHDTVAFGLQAKVKQLVMFHHDPQHTDDHLEALQRRASELWGSSTNGPVLAQEGMVFEL